MCVIPASGRQTVPPPTIDLCKDQTLIPNSSPESPFKNNQNLNYSGFCAEQKAEDQQEEQDELAKRRNTRREATEARAGNSES